jgi:hypothetical protein
MNYILYAKIDGKYRAINLTSNRIAENLLNASLIPAERFDELKTAATAEHDKTGANYQIRKAGTSQVAFSTEK